MRGLGGAYCALSKRLRPWRINNSTLHPALAGQRPSSLNASGLIVECRGMILTSHSIFSTADIQELNLFSDYGELRQVRE
jgi:hypothetical protein